MTVCIAACAVDGRQKRIVLCCDWKLTSGYGSSEATDKLNTSFAPGSGLVSMISGVMEDARDLERKLANLAGSEPLARDELKRRLHAGLKEFKKFYLELGKKSSDALVIVCGFPRRERLIFCVGWEGVSECHDPFVAVGSGASFAYPLLSYRYKQQTLFPFSNLDDVLYRVYEAKRFSETDDGVGSLTTLAVMFPPQKEHELFTIFFVPNDGLELLEKRFQEFGPHRLPDHFEQFPYVPRMIGDPGGHGGGNP